MTQITIFQWLSSQSTPLQGVNMSTTQSPLPRYQIVSSKKFYGHYDVLTQENVRLVVTFEQHGLLLRLLTSSPLFSLYHSITLLLYWSPL